MKKSLYFGFIFILILTLIVGCSSNNNSTNAGNSNGNVEGTNSNSGNGGNDNEAPSGLNAIDNMDDTLDITIMLPQWGIVGPENDHPIVQKLNEALNINLDIQWIPGAQYRDKISVLAVSNSLPDVYKSNPDDYLSWREKDVFMDVKPYISEFENLTTYLPEESWEQLNPKGKYYGVPYYSIPHLFSTTLRQDWLDNLGLQMPNTVEEFYEVAKAFALDDPDQNNKDDTVGLPLVIANNTFENIPYLEGAFGLGNEWKLLDDGTLIAKQAQTEELKGLIGFLRKAYAEGVLDKDFVVLKPADAKQKFWSGKSGIQKVNPNEIFSIDLPKIQENFPNATVSELVPPQGETGIRATHTEAAGIFKIVINSGTDEQKQIRILRLFDYMLSDEGYDLIKNGVEGVNYEKAADGSYTEIAEAETDPYKLSTILLRRADNGVQLRKYHDESYKSEVMDWFAINDQYDWSNPAVGLDGETEAFTKYNFATINAKWMSTMVRVITGDLGMDAVEDAVKEWLKSGGEQLIKEVNEVYQERQ